VRVIAFLLPATFLIGSPGAEASEAGSYSVGFRVTHDADRTRSTAVRAEGRPLQISVWYPAVSGGRPLVFRDYVALSASEVENTDSPAAAAGDAAAVKAYRDFLTGAGVAASDVDSWLATKMRATRDAIPASGRFPLVLIAQGNGQSAHDQVFLAELLAARGYIVATVPSQTRIDGPMQTEEDIPRHVEAQTLDLAFAARKLRMSPGTRAGRYGVIGHSFGARSALLLAMRDPDVGALVSLDGGIGGKAGKGQIEKARGFDRTRSAVPILHLYEEGDRFMVPDLDLLRSLAGPRWLVKVDAMRHVHFSSTGAMARTDPSAAKATSATPDTGAAWDVVAETTLRFLDRFLRDAAPLRASWEPPVSPLLHSTALPSTVHER
jgi:dienelactone hydrolase